MDAAIEETCDKDPPNPAPVSAKPPPKITVAVDSSGPFRNLFNQNQIRSLFNPNQIRNLYNSNQNHANEIMIPQPFDCSVNNNQVEASNIKPTLSHQEKNVICPDFQVRRQNVGINKARYYILIVQGLPRCILTRMTQGAPGAPLVLRGAPGAPLILTS